MYNTKFIMDSGKEIYPGYLDKETRMNLKNQYGNKKQYMWCGCRKDKKLYYRISEDLKIYPEHNNYEHEKQCSRYQASDGMKERQSGYMVDEQSGEVTTFLKFNPKNLNLEEEVEKEEAESTVEESEEEESNENLVVDKDENCVEKKEKKEPKLSLESLIRCMNVDTYTERVLKGKELLTKEEFSRLVYIRMNNIKISGMRKKIGELTLETDGVRFLYAPFAGCSIKKEKGLSKCYIRTIGKEGYEPFIISSEEPFSKLRYEEVLSDLERSN